MRAALKGICLLRQARYQENLVFSVPRADYCCLPVRFRTLFQDYPLSVISLWIYYNPSFKHPGFIKLALS
jgi:hypothetical protein